MRRAFDLAELGELRSRVVELAGELPPRPRLAIVGARAALRSLVEIADLAVVAAAKRGWSVVSGGALGIDAAVHRAALARGVAQLAVVPCGADRPYPPVHAALFAEIAQARASGVVYAQPSGTRPHRAMFVSRNAVVVAASDATLVVQAASPSGSETTGRLALRRHARVAAVIGTPGCDGLVGDGAWAIGAGDVGQALDDFLAGTRRPRTWPPELAALGEMLMRAGTTGATLDALGGPAAARLVFEAVAAGLVVEGRPGRWVAVGEVEPRDVRPRRAR